MAVIIATRKPEYNEQTSDNFNWYVRINYSQPDTLYSTLLIVKRTPSSGNSQLLRLNVSPLAKDYFRHTPDLTMPISIVEPNTNSFITVSLMSDSYNGIPFAIYDGWDGWVKYISNVIGVSNMNVTKKLFRDSKQYITAKPFGTDNIMWLLDDGNNVVVNNTFENTETNTIFPVIHPSLNVTNANNKLLIIGRDGGNQELWRLEYEFECPFDDAHTIGFVNKYGVWEFIDLTGNKKTRLMTSRNSYTKFDDGIKQAYNVNGDYKYEFNTGWVDKGFEDVMEGLLLSEAVVLYTGDGEDATKLLIDTDNINIQDSRTDKMVNYNFKATLGKSIIPIT